MRRTLIAASLIAASTAGADTPVLTVYAGDYFTSEWGPGPMIEQGFEATCGCDLQFSTGDLLPRLLLEGERTKADVVIGLTSDVTAKARATGLFAPHGQDNAALTLPIDWTDDTFLPFNYGHTAFIYNSETMAAPPASFDALLEMPDDVKIVIQDPRTSISGLALVLWVQAVYGDKSGEVWEKLAPKILTVTKDWSASYGLFTDGEADMVLSYTTSPAYHLIAEGDDTKAAAPFAEGHYLQIEVAGVLEGSDSPDLARAFLDYLVSEAAQAVIPETNWMYPAVTPAAGLPAGFETLHRPERSLYLDPAEAEALRGPAVMRWRDALSR